MFYQGIGLLQVLKELSERREILISVFCLCCNFLEALHVNCTWIQEADFQALKILNLGHEVS